MQLENGRLLKRRPVYPHDLQARLRRVGLAGGSQPQPASWQKVWIRSGDAE